MEVLIIWKELFPLIDAANNARKSLTPEWYQRQDSNLESVKPSIRFGGVAVLCGSDRSSGPLRERQRRGTYEPGPVTGVSGPGIFSAPVPALLTASDNEEAACVGGADI